MFVLYNAQSERLRGKNNSASIFSAVDFRLSVLELNLQCFKWFFELPG